jgi:hypothetical protein
MIHPAQRFSAAKEGPPMDMPEDSTRKSYRELAAKCREMAAHSAKPAPLVMLAEHYEAIAAEAEPRRP